jgi:RNA polymerase sigma-70 factor, ECF subfamily
MLREICGLETEQIAPAFLAPAPSLAQSIARTKQKIRDAIYFLSGPVSS